MYVTAIADKGESADKPEESRAMKKLFDLFLHEEHKKCLVNAYCGQCLDIFLFG